jgi:hypothetical protein
MLSVSQVRPSGGRVNHVFTIARDAAQLAFPAISFADGKPRALGIVWNVEQLAFLSQ